MFTLLIFTFEKYIKIIKDFNFFVQTFFKVSSLKSRFVSSEVERSLATREGLGSIPGRCTALVSFLKKLEKFCNMLGLKYPDNLPAAKIPKN